MLYIFFIAHWERPSRLNEWTTEVKANMVDFNISDNFDFLKSKSQDAFLTLVTKNGRKYELERLQKPNKSKTENLVYNKLELQIIFSWLK